MDYKIDIFLVLLFAFFFNLLPYRINFTAYFAIAPLLIIIYRRNFKVAVIFCAFAGFIAALFGFHWVYSYEPYIYPIVLAFMTVFFTLFAALIHFFYHRMKYLSLLVAPIIWIWLMLLFDTVKFGSYIFEFSMFNSLTAPLIWFVGGRGMTFIVILLNSTIAGFIIKKTKKGAINIAIILVIIVSCFIYSSIGEAEGEELKVALLQGNFDESWEWRQAHVEEIFEAYKELSQDKEGLIIWPEYALPVDITFYYKPLFKKVQELVKKTNTYFIIGSLFYDKKTEDHYDVALLFNPNGELENYYKSVRPAFFNDHTLNGDEGIKLLTINGKKAGVMICAEETDGEVARLQAKNGAQFFVSLSNDQGLGEGMYPTMLYSRLRAAENYKYFVRATNNGITQIVNPYGKAYKIEENKRKFLIGNIRLNEHKTLYTRYGNIPLYLITILFIIFIKKRKN